MTHAQKPDFVFRPNGRVHLNRRGASVQSTTDSRGVRISGSNVGYTMFRGSVKGTGYQIHSPVSPSFPLLCVTVCHHISTGVYLSIFEVNKEDGHISTPPYAFQSYATSEHDGKLNPVLRCLLEHGIARPNVQ